MRAAVKLMVPRSVSLFWGWGGRERARAAGDHCLRWRRGRHVRRLRGPERRHRGDRAINDRTDGTLVIGAAYVFVRSGGTWTQQAKLTTSFAGARLLGRSVSLDGDTAVVADDSNNASDSVYVFVRSGTAWTEQQRLPAPATSFTRSFGDSCGQWGHGTRALGGGRFFQGVRLRLPPVWYDLRSTAATHRLRPL